MVVWIHGFWAMWFYGKMAIWLHCIKLLNATSKRVYFVCFVNSFLYLRIYLSQYIRRCLHHNTEAPSEFFCSKCALAPSKPPWTGAFAFSFFLLEPSLLSLLAIFQLRCWRVFLWNAKVPYVKKTLPKAQRTRGLSSTYQINFFGSYHKFKHKSWSNIFRISTLHQLQNLNQTSPFRQNLNLKILTKPNQNLDQEWTS